MIIWLASYPRSGNTLTRTLIKSCFGQDSFDDEAQHIERILTKENRDRAGYVPLPRPWEDFYPEAKISSSVHLVKTHRLPQDNSPAIYVVRDGRSSIWSYFNFLSSYFPESVPSLLKVILGLDYYGGWSNHIDSWTRGPKAPRLVLRFEELVQADSALLSRIGEFIGQNGPIRPWNNPISELQEKDPKFYREGKTLWQRPDAWTDEVQNLFSLLHGDCQKKLGYGSEPFCGSRDQIHFAREMTGIISQLLGQNSDLKTVCQERLQLIEKFHIEAQNRLKLIEFLESEAKKRLDIIQSFHAPSP